MCIRTHVRTHVRTLYLGTLNPIWLEFAHRQGLPSMLNRVSLKEVVLTAIPSDLQLGAHLHAYRYRDNAKDEDWRVEGELCSNICITWLHPKWSEAFRHGLVRHRSPMHADVGPRKVVHGKLDRNVAWP